MNAPTTNSSPKKLATLVGNTDLNPIVLKPKYNFKIKTHPKSRINISKNELFPKTELADLSLRSLFERNDIFIFDYLGTSLKECLCAGKEIIFFDHGIYNYNSLFFDELSEVIHIIPIKYNENKINFAKDELFDAIENPKSDKKKKFDFINKYYL